MTLNARLYFHSPPFAPNQIRRQHGPCALEVDRILRSSLCGSLLIVNGGHLLQPCSLDLYVFKMGKELGWYETRNDVFLEIDGRIIRVMGALTCLGGGVEGRLS